MKVAVTEQMENILNERNQREDAKGYTPDLQVIRCRTVAKVKVSNYRLRQSLRPHFRQRHPNLYGSVGSAFTAVAFAA